LTWGKVKPMDNQPTDENCSYSWARNLTDLQIFSLPIADQPSHGCSLLILQLFLWLSWSAAQLGFGDLVKKGKAQDCQPVALFCSSKINWCLHPMSGIWDSPPREWFTDLVNPKIDWKLPTRNVIFGFNEWWPSGSRAVAVALAGRLVD
jgi:hypothetical protein